MKNEKALAQVDWMLLVKNKEVVKLVKKRSSNSKLKLKCNSCWMQLLHSQKVFMRFNSLAVGGGSLELLVNLEACQMQLSLDAVIACASQKVFMCFNSLAVGGGLLELLVNLVMSKFTKSC